MLFVKKQVIFFNIYGPVKPDPELWQNFRLKISSISNPNIIIGGDFNNWVDPFSDRKSNCKFQSDKTHKSFQSANASRPLYDVWNTCNPDIYEFTFFSPVHHTMSRIDYILVSKSLLPCIHSSEIGSIFISDHAPISASFDMSLTTCKQGNWCFNNHLLSDQTLISEATSFINEFFQFNKSSDTSVHNNWDAFKASFRAFTIAYSAKKNKLLNANYNETLQKIKNLEHAYFSSKSFSTLQDLNTAKSTLNKIATVDACNILLKIKSKFNGGQNKAGKLLANYLKIESERKTIGPIHSEKSNKHLSSDSDIVDTF